MAKQTSIETPDWVLMERCAALFAAEEFGGIDLTVVPNATIMGAISGVRRQIDVLVDARWSRDVTSRIIIDAKNRKRKLDVKDVESFEGMMRDCSAPRGVLVTPAGWTPAAARRAQDAITITLLSVANLDDFSFGFEPCLNAGCHSGNGHQRHGAVLWEEFIPSGFDASWVIAQVGKCDRCHAFHVWCWDCGTRFAVPDGEVIACGCEGREWASVPESAQSGHVGEPTSIWLMARQFGGEPVPFDRKPIR